MVTDTSDRGQVILIGAVALAFIIVGIVIVFNGVLYAETISSSSTSQGAADAKVSENELERTTIDIVHKSNMDIDNEYGNSDDSVNEALEAYQTLKANSSATTASGTITENEYGEAAVGTLESGADDELRIEDDTVGHMTVSLDTTDELEINTSEPALGPDPNPEAKLEHNGGWEYNDTPIEGVDDEPIDVDLVSGTVNGHPNAIEDPPIDPTEEYDNVTLTHIDGGEIPYGFVRQDSAGSDVDDPTDHDSANAVWSVDADWAYDSADVSFSRDNTVEIYERER